MHESATPVEAIVLSLAGVHFFQTDYPLELALQGKALIKNTPDCEPGNYFNHLLTQQNVP